MLHGCRLVAAGATTFALAGTAPASAATRPHPVYVLIQGNYLHNNHYGIYLNGRIHATIRQNRFHRVRVHIKVA